MEDLLNLHHTPLSEEQTWLLVKETPQISEEDKVLLRTLCEGLDALHNGITALEKRFEALGKKYGHNTDY